MGAKRTILCWHYVHTPPCSRYVDGRSPYHSPTLPHLPPLSLLPSSSPLVPPLHPVLSSSHPASTSSISPTSLTHSTLPWRRHVHTYL